MRTTKQIDDPTWDDIKDRDNLIRKLSETVETECEKSARPNLVLILDSCDDALEAIGDSSEASP
jgi:hypothetical protein